LIHAFFTKRLGENKPGELQNELNLTSNIHFSNQMHCDKTIERLIEIGSNNKNLSFAIKPAIKGDKYQLKEKMLAI
tara:strand:- start:933 stop:1160 length:228 start_codon:yes stop_codon:yes gene_type:complete